MREIKFRGQEVNTGVWVFGGYEDFKSGELGKIREPNQGLVFAVDPATVGQYTWLKDCEGHEIYEGDVIQIVTKNPYWAFKKNYAVYWDLDGFCLEGEPLYYWFKLHDLKVIGNVHDNHDLLEVRMTEESKYLLKAINALADALAYLGHVKELRNGADMEMIDDAKRQIMRAYDRCTFLYELLK